MAEIEHPKVDFTIALSAWATAATAENAALRPLFTTAQPIGGSRVFGMWGMADVIVSAGTKKSVGLLLAPPGENELFHFYGAAATYGLTGSVGPQFFLAEVDAPAADSTDKSITTETKYFPVGATGDLAGRNDSFMVDNRIILSGTKPIAAVWAVVSSDGSSRTLEEVRAWMSVTRRLP